MVTFYIFLSLIYIKYFKKLILRSFSYMLLRLSLVPAPRSNSSLLFSVFGFGPPASDTCRKLQCLKRNAEPKIKEESDLHNFWLNQINKILDLTIPQNIWLAQNFQFCKQESNCVFLLSQAKVWGQCSELFQAVRLNTQFYSFPTLWIFLD